MSETRAAKLFKSGSSQAALSLLNFASMAIRFILRTMKQQGMWCYPAALVRRRGGISSA